MSNEQTLGGNRLGSGKKQKVTLHGYERSNQNMGYLWRSTMSAGTLVPFMKEVALPGDTFDIDLECIVKTHPTVGPLFGSYKVQLDVFQAPIRLYIAALHNNKLKIGMRMAQIKLPQMRLGVNPAGVIPDDNPDNAQINPSCILSYLGIRGVGQVSADEEGLPEREMNAVPLIAYWDIYKNYYANKQEEVGYVIHKEPIEIVETIEEVGSPTPTGNIPLFPATGSVLITEPTDIAIAYSSATPPILSQIVFGTDQGEYFASEVAIGGSDSGTVKAFIWNTMKTGTVTILYWRYATLNELQPEGPIPVEFPLDNIDSLRTYILTNADIGEFPVILNNFNQAPYSLLLNFSGVVSPYLGTQEGLALKTYQSDLFNNWLSTDWIDGPGGINEIASVSTVGDSFTIDALQLTKKVYDMLNRIAVSGGTYDDWLDAVYDHDRAKMATTPIYHGGLSRELVFQEVISNAESGNSQTPTQPLGTLAGRGVMGDRRKGGKIIIKVDEPSYIIGIVSLTPRIDYSQGNKWDVNLKTVDDFHKPALDQIGFQDLITEQMAWWTTVKTLGDTQWVQKSAGKQPAWINYMTNVNEVRGNFAVQDNEMFMTLNRRYGKAGLDIEDLTTYIDPSKFNFIFADTAIDAQNFWTQIAVDMTVRRKMSQKVMPNL